MQREDARDVVVGAAGPEQHWGPCPASSWCKAGSGGAPVQGGQDWAAALWCPSAHEPGRWLCTDSSVKQKKNPTENNKPNPTKPKQSTKALAGALFDGEMEIWPESLAPIRIERCRWSEACVSLAAPEAPGGVLDGRVPFPGYLSFRTAEHICALQNGEKILVLTGEQLAKG